MRSYQRLRPPVAWILVSLTLLGTPGCLSDDEDTADLDIAMEEEAATPSPDAASELPNEHVVNWHAFFRPPPDQQQRSILSQRLRMGENEGDAASLIRKAHGEIVLGKLRAAEASFREALRDDADNADAILGLAQVYLRLDETESAFELLEDLHERLNPSDPDQRTFLITYRYTLALAYLARGDRKSATDVLVRLVAVDRTFYPAYVALAASYIEDAKFEAAEFILARARDAGAEDPMIYNLLGLVAVGTHHFSKARLWFDKAISLAPTFADAYVNRGRLRIERGDYRAAEDDFVRALMHKPFSAEAYVGLGVVQKLTSRLEEAEASLNKAIQLDPLNADARFNLAALQADDLGDPQAAIRLFSEVIQLDTTTEQARRTAEIYLQKIRRRQSL